MIKENERKKKTFLLVFDVMLLFFGYFDAHDPWRTLLSNYGLNSKGAEEGMNAMRVGGTADRY